MEPWYKVATPRKEVREGRSFNPAEVVTAYRASNIAKYWRAEP